jgi:hypothetical protein
MRQLPSRLSAVVTFSLLATLAACATVAQKPGATAPEPGASRQADTNAAANEESTFGEPTGLWEIPRDVQVAYAKAVCTAPESEFGFGGIFDDTTLTCATRNDMTSDVSFLMRNLLAKDSTQMQQTIDQMLEQSGATVPECPRPGGSGDAKNAAVTNECVIAAMQALTAYLND